MKQSTEKVIKSLVKSLSNFAEKPSSAMDNFLCHRGVCSKYECGRCGRAISAWNSIQKANKYLKDSRKGK